MCPQVLDTRDSSLTALGLVLSVRTVHGRIAVELLGDAGAAQAAGELALGVASCNKTKIKLLYYALYCTVRHSFVQLTPDL